MHADFWLSRWREGRIGFHQTHVSPELPQYWPAVNAPAGGRVLVPLCGKSLDMLWLAEQGFDVLGVELSPLAVEQFFEENKLPARQWSSTIGPHHQANYRNQKIEILCGDIFALDAATLATCSAVFDRGALVALPKDMRHRYAQHVYSHLAANYRGLLLTLDYAPEQTDSPPFSVDNEEVQRLTHPHTRATLLHRLDIHAQDPKALERGFARMDTLVYQLEACHASPR